MRNTKMSLQYATYALIATLGTFWMSGCSGSEQKTAAAQAMPPLSVATYHVVASDVPVSLEYPAKIKSILFTTFIVSDDCPKFQGIIINLL